MRALKSVLVSAGNVKRDRIQRIIGISATTERHSLNEAEIAENLPEQEVSLNILLSVLFVIIYFVIFLLKNVCTFLIMSIIYRF